MRESLDASHEKMGAVGKPGPPVEAWSLSHRLSFSKP